MTLAAALAATTTLVAVAFALSTGERWLDRRRAHHGAWTVALTLFAVASAAQWVGAAISWDPWSFRAFYLLGPILSVPYLALGSVHLHAPGPWARRAAVGVHVYAGFATGVLLTAPFTGDLPAEGLPQGSDVFGAGPRVLAAVGSGLPSLVIVAAAIASVARRRAVLANVLIALGTLVLGAAGLFNSVLDEMSAFALGHAIGLSVVFAGFLVANARAATARLSVVGDDQRSARRSTLPASPWGSSSTKSTFSGHL
jgi:hypothetical protein